MTDHNFQQLFNQNLLMLQEIKSDIKDLREDVGNLKVDVAVVKSDIANFKEEVTDLKFTVTNHINSDIHDKNTKSVKNTPSWMIILFVFLVGRISVDIVHQVQEFANVPTKQEPEFAPANSTAVDLNQQINKKILKKLVGE